MKCLGNCQQGRNCTCAEQPGDLPIVFVDGAFDWLQDMFYAGIELCGVLILLAVGVCGMAYGLRVWGLV